MKRYLLIISMALAGMASVQAQSQYQIYPFALCWNTGGMDSTIYRLIYFNAASPGTSKSLGYYDAFGNAVTVGGGTIESGCCAGDTIPINIVNPDFGMDTVIAQFTFNDTVVVQIDTVLLYITSNDTTFFSIDTLVVNVTSMDTVIVFSNDTIINISYDTTIVINNINVSDTTIVFSNDTVINITYDTSFCINYDTTIVIIDCDGGDLDSIVDFTIDCAEGIFTIELESGVTYSDTLNCLPDFLTLFFLTDSTTTYTVDASDTVIVSNGLSLDAVTGKDIELGGILDENTSILADSFSFTFNQANQAYLQTNEFAWILFKQFPRDSFSWRFYSLGTESNRAVVGTSEGMAGMYATNPTNEQNGFVALPDATWIFADNGLHIMAPRTDSTGLITIDTSMLDIVQPTWLLGIDSDSTVVKWPLDSVGGGGDGIYGGSGTIAPAAVATLDSEETFTIDYSDGQDAFFVQDAGGVGIIAPDGNSSVSVYDSLLEVLTEGDILVQADDKLTVHTDTIILTSGGVAGVMSIDTNLTPTEQPAWLLGLDADSIVVKWPLDSVGGGGGGIYSPGSGTIAPGAEASLDVGETFSIKYSDGNFAFTVDDGNSVNLQSPDNSTDIIVADDIITIDMPQGFMNWQDNKVVVAYDTLRLKSNGAVAPVFKIEEPSGDQAVSFRSPSLTANVNYLLPPDDGDSGEVLTTDGSGTLTWEPGGGSGDVLQGGNSFAAPMIIGTNDNNTLAFETNGTTAATIASNGNSLTMNTTTSTNNSVVDRIIVETNASASGSTGYGSGILLKAESSTTNDRNQVRLSGLWTTPTDASRTAAFTVEGAVSGGLAELFRVGPTSSMTNTGSFTYTPSTNWGGWTFSGGTLTALTSPNFVNINASISVGSGSGNPTYLLINGAVISTSSGVVRGIYINNTYSGSSIYRMIDLGLNNANAIGIYQGGASTTNRFVGGTTFGSTNAPDASVVIDAVSTTKATRPAPVQTNSERDAISSPVQGAMVMNSDVNALNIYDGQRWTGVGSRQFMILEDDFMSGEVGGTDGTIGSLGWIGLTGGGSLGYKTSSVANHPGVLELSTDASTSSTPAIYLVGNTQLTTGFKCEMIVNLPALATVGDDYQTYFGLLDTTGNAVNSIVFQYNRSSSTNWELVRSKNNSSTTSDSGVAVATGWNRFTIFYNGTNVIYYINGTSVLSTSTNIPTGEGLKPYFWLGKIAGTTPVTLEVDLFSLSQPVNR